MGCLPPSHVIFNLKVVLRARLEDLLSVVQCVIDVTEFIYTCCMNWDGDMGFYVTLTVSQMILGQCYAMGHRVNILKVV